MRQGSGCQINAHFAHPRGSSCDRTEVQARTLCPTTKKTHTPDGYAEGSVLMHDTRVIDRLSSVCVVCKHIITHTYSQNITVLTFTERAMRTYNTYREDKHAGSRIQKKSEKKTAIQHRSPFETGLAECCPTESDAEQKYVTRMSARCACVRCWHTGAHACVVPKVLAGCKAMTQCLSLLTTCSGGVIWVGRA